MVRINHSTDTLPELFLLDVISGKWTVMLVFALAQTTKRHSQLQRELDGISQKVLTQVLRNLERNGIVARKVYPVVPPHVEYSLTPLGSSLVDALSVVGLWAKAHHLEAAQARKQFDANISVNN